MWFNKPGNRLDACIDVKYFIYCYLEFFELELLITLTIRATAPVIDSRLIL